MSDMAESAPSAASLLRTQPASVQRLAAMRVGLLSLLLTVSFAWLVLTGGRNHDVVMPCLTLGVVALSLGTDLPWRFVRDWTPLILSLWAYRSSSAIAYRIGMPTHWTTQIEVDRWLLGGRVPSVWLQEHLMLPNGTVAWWERLVAIVYLSHFVVAIALALFLWTRSRARYGAFVLRFGAVLAIGVVSYVLVPAAPPWAAGLCTAAEVASQPHSPPCMYRSVPEAPERVLLPTNGGDKAVGYVQRLTTRGFGAAPGLSTAGAAVEHGSRRENLVAAVPSLHAAFSMLVAAFLWPTTRRRWRPLLALYPGFMAFTLMWTGDHYLIDILLGWLLVALVLLVTPRLLRFWVRPI